MFGKRGSGSRIPPHTLRAALPAAPGFSSRVFGALVLPRADVSVLQIIFQATSSGDFTSRSQKALTKRESPLELLTKRPRHSPERVQLQSERRLYERLL